MCSLDVTVTILQPTVAPFFSFGTRALSTCAVVCPPRVTLLVTRFWSLVATPVHTIPAYSSAADTYIHRHRAYVHSVEAEACVCVLVVLSSDDMLLLLPKLAVFCSSVTCQRPKSVPLCRGGCHLTSLLNGGVTGHRVAFTRTSLHRNA